MHARANNPRLLKPYRSFLKTIDLNLLHLLQRVEIAHEPFFLVQDLPSGRPNVAGHVLPKAGIHAGHLEVLSDGTFVVIVNLHGDLEVFVVGLAQESRGVCVDAQRREADVGC